MTTTDAYAALSEKLGFPGSALLREILEELMTAEQACLADALPGTVAEVAERAEVSEEEARAGLDELFYKGVIPA